MKGYVSRVIIFHVDESEHTQKLAESSESGMKTMQKLLKISNYTFRSPKFKFQILWNTL